MSTRQRTMSCAAVTSTLCLLSGCLVGTMEDDEGELGELEDRAPRNGFLSACELDHRLSDDPIVFPGEPGASHRHSFYGNESTDAGSTSSNMLRKGTSCAFDGDTAAYWMPTATKGGNPIETMGGRMYYRRGRLHGHINPYPYGLRMIAGDGMTTHPQSLDVVHWGCTKNEGERFYLPPDDCGDDHVNAVVVFPNCWDGKNLDSPDHKSHMAYDVDGQCPATHPVQMPHLFLDFQFRTSQGKYIRLSSDMPGMPGGMSLHADFWNTWHQEKLEAKVQTCFNTDAACGELE